jgi:very-short-patch-repair endonuclease
MILRYRPQLKPYAKRLRREMTDAESRLWHRVRRKQILGVQFYRQKPIGPYIVDFYAPAAGLVVEIDGSQHLDATTRIADSQRDAFLASKQLKTLRFDNRAVLTQTDAVVERIYGVVAGAVGRGNPP